MKGQNTFTVRLIITPRGDKKSRHHTGYVWFRDILPPIFMVTVAFQRGKDPNCQLETTLGPFLTFF